jgi:SNF2 family DNA or RNA helicase
VSQPQTFIPDSRLITTSYDQTLTLFNYQQQAANLILTGGGSAILGMDAGLGKSCVAINAIVSEVAEPSVLICAPKTAIGVWADEWSRWQNKEAIVYADKPKDREKAADLIRAAGKQPLIVVTNYALLNEVLNVRARWNWLVCDEAHMVMRRQSKTWKSALSVLASKHIICTGSLVNKGPMDMWPMLHLCWPNYFRSFWQFREQFCTFQDGPGYQIYTGPKNTTQLKGQLKGKVFYLRKSQVSETLPPKIRQSIYIQMGPEQKKLYNEMAKNMIVEWDPETMGGDEKGYAIAPNVAVKLLRLRQILVAPQTLGAPVPSAMLDAVSENLEAYFSSGQSALVFTPFRASVPLLREALIQNNGLKPSDVEVVMGGMTWKDIDDAVRIRFQNNKKARKAIVGTTRAAISWTATAASVVAMAGYELDPNQNSQAEDRAHRATQTQTVNCLYFLYKNTIDMHNLAQLSDKIVWRNLILEPARLLAPDTPLL